MKSFLIFLLAISSSMTFAARLPTLKELRSYDDQIRNGNSVSSIIKDIKSGKIDPIVSLINAGNAVSVEPGVSGLAYQLIYNRFDARKPIGSEQENLELLDTIIKSGVNLNYLRDPAFPNEIITLMDAAATTCSPSAINLLIKNGANPSLEDFYWVKAFNSSFNEDQGTQYNSNCIEAAEFLSDKAKEIGAYSIEKLFYPLKDQDAGVGSFTEGATMDERFTSNMKISLENLGVKLSAKPEGEAPSDAWWNEFVAVMGSAIGQDYRDYGMNWWNKQSDTEKAWACYYSSFDEALTAFHNLGATDERLTTKSVGGNYTMRIFNKFPVYVFGPYCNSIK